MTPLTCKGSTPLDQPPPEMKCCQQTETENIQTLSLLPSNINVFAYLSVTDLPQTNKIQAI